jgi:iron complex outermembrane receptor protein
MGNDTTFADSMPANHSKPPRIRLLPGASAVRLLFVHAAMPFAFGVAGAAHGQTPPPSDSAAGSDKTLPAVKVQGATDAPLPGDFAPVYGGGQVARGASFGVLGTQEMIDVPFSMTSYTSKLIEEQQARTLADVLDNDPAVRSLQGFGNQSQTFVIRGFQLNGDDMSLNGLYGITPRQLVVPESLERVDVFKGANAFLNGASPTGSAIGGGVNLELKRANDKPLTRVTVDASGSGELGTHVDVGRRFGSEGQFGIRVNSMIRDGETSVDGEHKRDTATSVSLDYRGDKLRLYGDFLYQRDRVNDGRPTVNLTGTNLIVPAVPSATHNYAQSWSSTALEDTAGIARAEYDFLPAWTAYIAGGIHHNNEHGDYSSPNFNGDTGATTASRLGVPHKSEGLSAEGGVRGRFATGPVTHFVTLGGTITSVENRSAFDFSATYTTDLYNTPQVPRPSATPNGNFADPLVSDRTLVRSVAVSDTFGFLNDRVLFTLGARRQELHQNNYSTSTGTLTSSYDAAITSPLLGLVVKPWQNVAFYANRSEALAQGGEAPQTASNFGEKLAPQRSKQFEVGVKYDTRGFGASFAAYQIEQPSAYVNSGNVFAANGYQRHRGLETAVYGEPLKGVRLLAGASLIQAELLDTNQGLNDGNRPTGVPSFLLNLGAEYDVPMLPGVTLTARWLHTGKQYVDVANTAAISSWNRFDLGARYATRVLGKSTTFRASVLNVANNAYWESAATSGQGYITQGAPRTFLFSMTTDF